MVIKETVLIGENVLRETPEKVVNFDDIRILRVIEDLTDTMRSDDLIGMATPQIEESLPIFVSEIRETETRKGITDELKIYINPVITDVSHETELGWEGCGSIPGIFGKVSRAKEVTVEFFDSNGVMHKLTATNLLARVIQHEIDHINGILFTDLADPRTFVSREYYLDEIVGKK